MRVLLIPVGSAGDVHPFVGIGMEMKRRGHSVTVLTSGYFRSMIEKAGLSFEELSTAEQFLKAAEDPHLWDPIRGFSVIAEMVVKFVPPMVDFIKRFNIPGRTIVAGGSLAFGARIAEERWGIPTATIHLQPGVLRSVYDPPILAGPRIPKWFPSPWIRAYYKLIDRVADRPLHPINDYRREFHLPRVQGFMGSWLHSPRMTIGLFPEWFAPPQKDWPISLHLTGFPFFDGKGVEEVSPDTEPFLNAGSPPIIFTAGSAMRFDKKFFEESDRAVRLIGCRAAYLTRFPEQLPFQISVTAKHLSYVPFSQIFPRAAAIVHHGGVGTTAQAFLSGRPQLVVPRAHDQFDNAARVQKLGAGWSLKYSRYSRRTVANLLKRLVSDKKISENGKRLAGMCATDGISRAADLLESLNSTDY